MANGSTTIANSAGLIDRSMVEQIVRQVALDYLGKGKGTTAPVLTVQTSSRHMHVCREDMPSIARYFRKATSRRRKQ
jgi:hypothetical protein